MPISREEWQAELREKIKTSLPRLKQKGITSGYAIIAATTILPVIVAGGGWFTALVTLVGSVGANLITNCIQDAKDDVELADRLQKLTPDDQVNQYIHLLLEKLDAMSVVQQGLPESDWFRLELLLDRKFTEYQGTYSNIQSVLDAPVIIEEMNRSRAITLSYKVIKRTWWAKKLTQKPELQLYYWPMVFYEAQYLVKYQNKDTDDIHDSEGNIVDHRTIITDHTDNVKLELVICPSTVIKKDESVLPEIVYRSISGVQTRAELGWGKNSISKWIYEELLLSFSNYLKYNFNKKNFNFVRKNLSYWKDNQRMYKRGPGTIPFSYQGIQENAQKIAKQTLVKIWNSDNTFVSKMDPVQEKMQLVHYPFWVFKIASETSLWQIVIDGLTGNVVFINAPANYFTQFLVLLFGLCALIVVSLPLLGLIYIFF